MNAAEREMLMDLVDVLAATFTKAGHPAQTVGHEHLGICSHRRCSPICHQRRALLIRTTEYLEATAAPVVEQMPLLEAM